MKATISIQHLDYQINLDRPLSIGIPLNPFGENPSCFYAPQPKATPMIFNDFICSVDKGAPVNFYSLEMIPHGNGTHTECVGHITNEMESVNQTIKNPFFLAYLISVTPDKVGTDSVISEHHLQSIPILTDQALIIRTLPNSEDKKTRSYTGQNPAYLDSAATQLILSKGVRHLILDLPSIDREEDGGLVANHKTFWNYPNDRNMERTITEMAFVPNHIPDGTYILNLKTSNLKLDAVPSEPILYKIERTTESH